MTLRKDATQTQHRPLTASAPPEPAQAPTERAAEPVQALIDALANGQAGAAITFAGQGASCLPELAALLDARPELWPWIERANAAIADLLVQQAFAWSGLYARGFDLCAWLRDPDARPDEAYLTSSAISQPLIFITQIARYQALYDDGLGRAFEAGAVRALTGHSQGMMPALLIALSPQGQPTPERFVQFVQYFTWQGLWMARSYAAAQTAAAATPMVAISGIEADALQRALERLNRALPEDQRAFIALYNTRSRSVVSGPAPTLQRLQQALEAQAEEQQRRKRQGRFAGRVQRATFEFLAVGAAFHSPFMRVGLEGMLQQVRAMGFQIDPAELRVDVLSPEHGGRFQDSAELTVELVTAQFVRPVRWTRVTAALARRDDLSLVLDLGPSDAAARLTRANLRGAALRVLALTNPDEQRALFTPGAAPDAGASWARFQPRLLTLPGGRVVVDNLYTRSTGQSPMILPGMTPTTADAEIVAAAANAGFTAELAGGGQVTAEIFAERLRELSERLQPGAEIVFNALFLDPWLWELHLGRQRLVQKARRAGAPIRGVTISAGMPAPEDAARLLDELAALGIWHNAFKPGTLDQIQHVTRIARAAPQHTIFVHLEGGRAGGHHSWEDLEQLLLDGYHLLRAEPNLVLCVGGGVATPERAAALLSGRWSLAHELPLMPVDAILLGTVTMACAEARTSPAVKAALAAAPGVDQWVFSGEVAGGVTSGRSQLNADIHYLENAAARCGRLLDEVAGDADAVQARRDEIIAALNATAKPYFGDLAQMTYLEVARRVTALMAIGSGGRYEDGRWLDRSWRLRVVDFLRRAEARLTELQEGTFPSFLQGEGALDDPEAALGDFASRYPDAATRRLHPADQDFFVALCRRPGKPVNFVPVIDADVRRWFKSDSLWQSHDPRYGADEVLIIPGPEALRGIERADEPVADLLARFEQALIDQLQAQGVEAPAAAARHLPPRERFPQGLAVESRGGDIRLRPTHSAQPDWFDYVARSFAGAPARLLGERRIFDEAGRSWPNPLRQLCLPVEGSSMTLTVDGPQRRVLALTWRGPGSAATVRAVADGDEELRLEVVIPALEAEVDPAVYLRRLRLRGDAFVERAEGRDRALRDFYHDALFGRRLQPAPLFTEVAEEVQLPRERVEGYRALTGASHGDPALPLNMAFSLVWRPLMRTLSCDELSGGLLDLVHLSNEIAPGPGWPARHGEPLEARARVTRVEDAEAGRAVTALATLWRGDQRCATVTSRFFIRGDYGQTPRRAQAREEIEARLHLRDAAAADLLAAQPWLQLDPGVTLCEGMELVFKATLTEDRPRQGEGRWGADGALWRSSGERAGEVRWEASGAWTSHPAREAAALLAAGGAARRATARRTLASATVEAPAALEPFAQVSADLNPIHRSELMAALAGLEAPIVHGMWSAARMHSFLVAEVAGGVAARVTRYGVEFLAPALRGERLVLRATRVGAVSGDLEVEVSAAALRGGAEVPVAKALATVRAPKTAYVLPGQGIQQQGMGMQGYGRSAAAREVWDRADRYTRRHLGFSILRVVRENPTELIVQGASQLHPKGVLHLTQFTQVAMAVTAMAQVAELREAGVLVEDAITCGHSVGEYNALAAIAQVLPLEDVVAIVYQRGGVMHQLVPRDEKGASQYKMGVIRPNCARLDHAGAEALVAQVRQETGLALEIVNYNIRGWQYSVTGHKAALERLRDALEARRPADAREPYLEVPGVDVPFHSRVLQGGVESFRQTLDARLPARLDYERLLGRYIPNLVPRPWSLSREYIQEVFDCTQAEALGAVLADFEGWSARPDALARVLLIELLAWQFASPVRWIETQELMMRPVHQGGLGVERVIEVGVGYQPTLVGMARATARGLGHDAQHIEIINIESDAERVFYQDVDRVEAVEVVDAAAPEAVAAPVAAVAAPVVAVATSSAPVEDRPLSVQEALLVVLSLQARVRPSQISLDESIDDLFEGVSSRRNQVLLDLGAEFEAGAIDGAHEKPLRALAEELGKRNGRYKAPGAYLRAAQEEALGRALGRARLRRREVAAYLSESWGLGEGWVERALCGLALEARAGDSGRGGALGSIGDAAPASAEAGRQVLDQLMVGLGGQLGVTLGKRGGAAGGGGAVDAAAVQALGDQIIGPRGVLAQSARELLERLGEDTRRGEALPEASAEAARLARWEAEHGAEYERLIQPAFDARRHVALTSAWATAQRDIVRLFYEGRQGRLSGPQIASEAARLSAFGSEPRARQTALWCAAAAAREGHEALSEALARIAQGGAAPLEVGASRPWLEIDPRGRARYEERPDSAAAFLGRLGAWSAAPVAGWEGFLGALEGALRAPLSFLGRTALVTGASPGSIAWEVVRHLLRGGARVVVTTTSATPARIRQYKALYGACAAPGAELHVVPFNQASNQDVDALVEWLFTATTEQAGAVIKVLKRPFAPDLIVPFGALGDVATLDSPSDRSLAVVRALLLGVERLIGAIGRRYRREGVPATPCHVVLPLSPNHGVFGGDGAYAETKAALEVVLEKWRSEQEGWGRAVTLCGAKIGWVRGTGLMDANNLVAAGLERETGALTFSSGEMGLMIAALCTAQAGERARAAPLMADLTGGFGAQGNIKEVVERLRAEIAAQMTRAAALTALQGALRAATGLREPAEVTVEALPDPLAGAATPGLAEAAAWPGRGVDLREAVVIVGAGEVGPWGHARTRFEVEVADELSPGGALELAWLTGLVRYEGGRWLDAQSGQELPEGQIAAHTRAALRQRSGIRWIEPQVAGYDPDHLPVMAKVYLERDFTFPVASADEARLFVEADPEHTEARFDAHEEAWRVTRRAGTQISVPRKMKLNRKVAGLVPTGFDPARYGLSPDMIENIDRATLFNLIATADAFLSAGLSPEELLRFLHPARVANTQGSGIGGMQSLQRLYTDGLLGQERQSDVLQETLVNVVAAYVVQSYVGSYGPMVHPVAACATAAVSLEEGMDKILMGRADFVVAGGFDDIGVEGAVGFSDMNATASSEQMAAMGLEPWQMSRSNDVRRRGFVEAQGGGTLLLARGDVALQMGLPVLGVLGWAGSFGDGIHKSIPAPGMGALAAAMGGQRSPLGRALSMWGLTTDDIALVYKHDTSTQANDPNENALHHRIQEALGRAEGNPLWAVSQKTLTGHPKGGAAAWQVIGLCQSLAKGLIPGNRNLDCVDEAMRPWRHVAFTDQTLDAGPGALRAGLVTSLGFGHVGAIALVLHPAAFVAQLDGAERERYQRLAQRRAADARDAWARVWMNQQPAFTRRADRRFDAADGTACQEREEAALLLNPDARLDLRTGRFTLAPEGDLP